MTIQGRRIRIVMFIRIEGKMRIVENMRLEESNQMDGVLQRTLNSG